jgi:hypothetical protein
MSQMYWPRPEMTTRKEETKMKKLIVVIALVTSVVKLVHATAVTVDYSQYPQCSGTTCGVLVSGSQSQVQLTPEPVAQIVQTVINNNNITVPATVGSGVNGATPDTVGNLNFVGTGLNSSVTGSGATSTSNVDFSNLQTNQSVVNASAISGIQNMTDNSVLTNTVNGLQSTSNSNTTAISNNSTAISNIQNLNDNSLLTQTVNNHTAQISQNTAGIAAINNMTDPTTVLNQTVNGNTTAIANETTRATGAENTLANGLSNEAATRASADQALQSQINNVNAQAQDDANRIDRLEQTKYLLEPTVRLYDDKHFQVQAFDSYDVRHDMNFAAGLRVMFKVGPSYEEKLMKKTNPEIARLLAANVSNDVVERDAIRNQLAEDKALIAKQSALLKDLQSQFAGLKAVDINLAATSGNNDDLMKAVEKDVEGK